MRAAKMKTTISFVLLISSIVQHILGASVLVRVKQGLLSGERLKTVTGECYYYSFKGIPYAKPPVGELRFKAPCDPEPWKGIKNATAHGPTCPQITVNNELIPGSEDCLFINVYTCEIKPKKAKPVMVWIPGGAYKFGSGDDNFYGPDFLVCKDVVLITLNYRLNALGFLSMHTCEVPGNAGLKDQVAALKWVQNNIQYFGGDPNQVTIIGESAAAGSVGYHLISPLSKCLFHRAVMMSGAPTCDYNTFFKPTRRAFILGKSLGLETKNKTELLSFLQKAPYEKIVNASCELMASELKTNVAFKMIPFPPVIEKECPKDSFLTEDPMKVLKTKNVNKVDVMFSYTSQEALYAISLYEKYLLKQYNRFPEIFVPSKILNKSTPDQNLRLADRIIKYYFGDKTISLKNMAEFINYSNSISFVYGTQKFAKLWSAVGRCYFLKFSSYSSRNYYGLQGAPYGIYGAGHFDDILYIFDPKSLNMTLKKNSKEYKMVQQITTAITNFVKYGNPTPDRSLGVIWPQFNKTSLAYVEFTDKMKVRYALDEKNYQFWESIYKEARVSP